MSAAGEVRVRLSVDGKLLGPRGQAEKIRKLLADGGLKRIRVVFVPRVVGAATAPTLLGVPADSLLESSVQLRLERVRRRGDECEAVYAVRGCGKFASATRSAPLKKRTCKQATQKISLSAA